MSHNSGNTQELLTLALEELARERAQRMEAEAKLEAQKGKVLFADAVRASEKSIKVGEMAHILKQSGIETGETRLFQWLREHEYLYRMPGGDNRPTQKSLNLGVMDFEERLIMGASGRSKVRRTVKITPEGQIYFMEVLNRHKEEINTKEAAKKKERISRATEVRRKKRLEEKAQLAAEQQSV